MATTRNPLIVPPEVLEWDPSDPMSARRLRRFIQPKLSGGTQGDPTAGVIGWALEEFAKRLAAAKTEVETESPDNPYIPVTTSKAVCSPDKDP